MQFDTYFFQCRKKIAMAKSVNRVLVVTGEILIRSANKSIIRGCMSLGFKFMISIPDKFYFLLLQPITLVFTIIGNSTVNMPDTNSPKF